LVLVGSYGAYFQLGKGVEFFPYVEPELALVHIHARGDLSIRERDAIVRQVELSSRDTDRIPAVAARIRDIMDEVGGFADVEDNRPLPGIEWRLEVDRERAARYGADVAVLGNAVQMITQGIKVSEYRPEDNDDEVDIRVRFPYAERNLGQLDSLRVPTANGMVPITNFVRVIPAPKTGTLNRVDARRVGAIDAALETGRRRLRPVFLTAFTTVLGLMPMVLAMNIDLIGRAISFGAPSTQWWTQLASAIAGGLSFATILTLVLTPCLLVLGDSMGVAWRKMVGRFASKNADVTGAVISSKAFAKELSRGRL
jgi:multidrug efflux pump subunit AcrB